MRKYRKKSSKYRRKRRFYRRKRYGRRNSLLRADYSAWLRLPASQIENDNITVERGQYTFALSAVPSYTTLKNLFDQYKINKVIISFKPIATEIINRAFDDATTGTPLLTPMFVSAITRDDDSLPANYADVLNLQGSRERKMTRGMKWIFRPSVLNRLGGDAPVTYAVQRPTWINTKYPDCPHFGLTYAVQAGSTSKVFVHDVEAKIHVSFRLRKNL